MNLLHKSWFRLWSALGTPVDGTLIWDNLIHRYSEAHRRYHTLQHLQECIGWFDLIAHLAIHPAEIEAALWFHDAVYDLHRQDNEERSAQLAGQLLTESGVSAESVTRIKRLVLLTRHSEVPVSPDEQFTVDIDLAVLGSSEERFSEYETQIREEYAFVPDEIFYQKRQEILVSFLCRQRIYYSDYFHALLDKQARYNLSKAIDNL